MTFGKLGRPPEDRLARQDEIYRAVSPLIVEVGARQLSMRQAARAASLSIGGLYYYFPTKRELLLHGLCPAALLRYCAEFHAEFDHLTASGPAALSRGGNPGGREAGAVLPALHPGGAGAGRRIVLWRWWRPCFPPPRSISRCICSRRRRRSVRRSFTSAGGRYAVQSSPRCSIRACGRRSCARSWAFWWTGM